MLNLRIIIPILAVVGVVLAFWALSRHYYDQGWGEALVAVEKQDAKAVDAARRARQARAKCTDDGGTWDASRGMCDRE